MDALFVRDGSAGWQLLQLFIPLPACLIFPFETATANQQVATRHDERQKDITTN